MKDAREFLRHKIKEAVEVKELDYMVVLFPASFIRPLDKLPLEKIEKFKDELKKLDDMSYIESIDLERQKWVRKGKGFDIEDDMPHDFILELKFRRIGRRYERDTWLGEEERIRRQFMKRTKDEEQTSLILRKYIEREIRKAQDKGDDTVRLELYGGKINMLELTRIIESIPIVKNEIYLIPIMLKSGTSYKIGGDSCGSCLFEFKINKEEDKNEGV